MPSPLRPVHRDGGVIPSVSHPRGIVAAARRRRDPHGRFSGFGGSTACPGSSEQGRRPGRLWPPCAEATLRPWTACSRSSTTTCATGRGANWRGAPATTRSARPRSSTRRISGWRTQRPRGGRASTTSIGVVVKAMRSVVVDYARRRSAKKRGALGLRIDLTDGLLQTEDNAVDVLAVDEGLRRLAEVDDRLCELVELRFFGGMSREEAASVMGVSARTVRRDWQKARALLFRELARSLTCSPRGRTAIAAVVTSCSRWPEPTGRPSSSACGARDVRAAPSGRGLPGRGPAARGFLETRRRPSAPPSARSRARAERPSTSHRSRATRAGPTASCASSARRHGRGLPRRARRRRVRAAGRAQGGQARHGHRRDPGRFRARAADPRRGSSTRTSPGCSTAA